MSGFVWTDAAVREALGLRADLAEAGLRFSGISTDSRTISEGELYVALVGERFDGHHFVAEALSRGAAAAVVSHPVAGEGEARLYPVDDTLAALGALAAHRRRALSVPVVAITGSSGKTTTKDFLVGALSRRYRVHATPANLNNRIGLPQTVLATPDDAEVVVLEAGTNEPGEIRALTEVAHPDIAVLVTVGESHLEKLGSVEGVLEEKADLLRGRAPGARCVVGDEPAFMVEAARELCPELRVAGWSERADADLRPVEVEVDHWGAHRFRWRDATVQLSVPGRHAVSNALLALAVAEMLEVPPEDAARGLSAVPPRSLRSEPRRIGDLTVVVDCYNANPQSVAAALDLLEAQEARGRVAVLGTMLELGPASPRLHRAVLEDALGRELALVVATGAFAEAAAARDAGEAGSVASGRGAAEAAEGGVADPGAPDLLVAGDWRSAWPELRARLEGDETLLLKASRGVAMEGLLGLLEEAFGRGEDASGPDGAGEGA